MLPKHRRSGNSYMMKLPTLPQLLRGQLVQHYITKRDRQAPLIQGQKHVINMSRRMGWVQFRQPQATFDIDEILDIMRLFERLSTVCWDRKHKEIEPTDFHQTLNGLMKYCKFGKSAISKVKKSKTKKKKIELKGMKKLMGFRGFRRRV